MSEVKTNKISSLASNNNITIDPDGTGDTIIASGSVGIGTTSGTQPSYFNSFLNVQNNASTSDHASVTITSGSGGFAGLHFGDSDNGRIGQVTYNNTDDALIFTANNSERCRVDSSGNLLVGQSSTTVPGAGNTTAGTSLRGTDGVFISRTTSDTSASALQVNKTTGTGVIINVASGGSTVGNIGFVSSGFFIQGETDHSGFRFGGNQIVPFRNNADTDNTTDLGASGARFDDIFATNGTINTSDQNEKQQIASLTTAEITAAKAISALFKTFKWKDKVEAKGDAARTHTGVIAQEVQQAMTDAGLDAADYAFWCSDTWTDDDGNSQTRMGIRYPELLAFVGAATEQRLADIETRLTALEAE